MLFRTAAPLSGGVPRYPPSAQRVGERGLTGRQPRMAGAALNGDVGTAFLLHRNLPGNVFLSQSRVRSFITSPSLIAGRTQPEPLPFYLSDKFHIDLELFKTFHHFSPKKFVEINPFLQTGLIFFQTGTSSATRKSAEPQRPGTTEAVQKGSRSSRSCTDVGDGGERGAGARGGRTSAEMGGGEWSPVLSRPDAAPVAPVPGCLFVECGKTMGNPQQRQ